MMDDDAQLLVRYVERGSEEAFAEIVRRRVGLVYGVALRRTGNVEQAKDATQATFISLARHARKLTAHPALAGWLYRSAYNAAMDITRAEGARARREMEAQAMMHDTGNERTAAGSGELRLLLDEAVLELEESDRTAVVLRFFEERSFAEVGTRLRTSENAARMRVQRALEKLRGLLARRGLATTAEALALTLGAQAVAAPAGLAAAVTNVVAASGVGVGAGAGAGTATGIFLTMNAYHVAGVAIVAAGVAGAAWVGTRGESETGRARTTSGDGGLVRFEANASSASAATEEPKRAARETRSLAGGERLRVGEMAERGNATPAAAAESLLRAQEDGDVDRVVALSYLPPDAVREAEKFFASLAADRRAEFRTPERLVAAFFCGAGAIDQAPGAKSPDFSYELEKAEPGVKVLPLAWGLPEEAATNENFHTLRTIVRRADGSVVTRPIMVFHRAPDGWKSVVPPSTIPAFARMLTKGAPKRK